jgi:hypothetical protein
MRTRRITTLNLVKDSVDKHLGTVTVRMKDENGKPFELHLTEDEARVLSERIGSSDNSYHSLPASSSPRYRGSASFNPQNRDYYRRSL